MKLLERITTNPSDRRRFMKQVGATGLGVAAASMVGSTLTAAAFAQDSTDNAKSNGKINDVAILNFALNLEYLEAEFYSVATTGQTLLERGVLTESEQSGPTVGGHQVPGLEQSPLNYIANNLRQNEVAHVRFLRAALGAAAVKKPTIDLAALGYGFDNWRSFLKLSRQFEDVGVSAYLGAAPLIKSKEYLAAAAAILATEAQHSGSIRVECVQRGIDSPAVDSKDIPPTMQHLYDVDNHALSIPRTPAEVLNIVYAGGKCSGGFYPDGMNGTIVCH
jgi:Ferritin-like domain